MVEITLEGPGKNALSTEVLTELREALAAADGAPVLLRGAGDAFSAGLHLGEVGGFDVPSMARFACLLEETCEALFRYPAPVVAAVNGHAIAGGAVIALCCDHRVVTTASKMRMGLNEVALGLRFPPMVLRIVAHRLGVQAREVVLGAGLYDPEGALRVGLADELADDPVAVARERLAVWGSHPAHAYALGKADLQRGIPSFSEGDRRMIEAELAPLWVSEPVKRGIVAALMRTKKS